MYGRIRNVGLASAAVLTLVGAARPLSDPLGVFDHRSYPKPAKKRRVKRKFKGSKAAKKASRK